MSARAILLCLGLAAAAFGKSAEDYFHGASYKYVDGKRQEARLEVEEGLRRYPDDARLKGLAAQLRDLDDQNKQDKKSGGGEQDKKDKDKQDSGKKDPDKDKDKGKDKPKPDEKKKDEGKDNPRPEDPKDDGKQGKNPGGVHPGEMSPQEAQRLLDAFADDEKKEQRERQKLLRKRLETEQDW